LVAGHTPALTEAENCYIRLTTVAQSNTNSATISSPLEDYLETIYLLVQEHGFARVRDIARARDVKASSVSVALRKLAEVELVDYERREFIGLTSKGEATARRVLSRHRLLARFFEEVLRMPAEAASDQACAMEHSLTDEAMGRLVSFFEFLTNCPTVTEAFGRCPLRPRPAGEPAAPVSGTCRKCERRAAAQVRTVADLALRERAVVVQISATGATRQRLLDHGILPETEVLLEQAEGNRLVILCQGATLTLTRAEARALRVRPA
jgi:DtxR family Mn-dependent transcriptional regulator